MKTFELNYKEGSKIIGDMGESFALDYFRECGFIVMPKLPKNGDLRILCPITGEILKIEVKTATMRTDFKYMFHIINQGQDYRHSDYIFAICIANSGNPTLYLIPCLDIDVKKTITIPHLKRPGLYKGKWSKYLLSEPPLHLSIKNILAY